MDKRKVLQAIEIMNSRSVKEYLDDNKVKIYSSKDNFDDEDAYLCNGTIFIRKYLYGNYRNFILLHEIGHHIMHSDLGVGFGFSLKVRKNKLEIEANTFACMCILRDECLDDVNIIDLLMRKGVPEQIAVSFYENFSLIYNYDK